MFQNKKKSNKKNNKNKKNQFKKYINNSQDRV